MAYVLQMQCSKALISDRSRESERGVQVTHSQDYSVLYQLKLLLFRLVAISRLIQPSEISEHANEKFFVDSKLNSVRFSPRRSPHKMFTRSVL